MIGSLKGIIEETGDDYAVIDVGGVGYSVFCASSLLATLNHGDAVKLSIETNVREDHIHLYGFENTTQREWFRLLTSVQRVGNKMALNILSALPPATLLNAIMAKDVSAFSRISGVGAKLAERIITELKDKAMKLPIEGSFAAGHAPDTGKKPSRSPAPALINHHEDAISALVNLGFTRMDAYGAITRVQEEAGADATIDQLIRLSLKQLAR